MSELRPEHRISAVEKRVTHIEGNIEELSADTAEELKSIRQEIKVLNDKVDQGFLQVHTYINEYIASKEDISRLKGEIMIIENHIRQDMIDMKNELLDEIKILFQQKQGE